MSPATSRGDPAPAESADDGPAIRGVIVRNAIGVWVVLAVVAVTNAVLRETLVTPRVGEAVAHVVGTATAILGFLAVLTAYLRTSRLEHTDRELVAVGGLWTAMTVAFESGFGHYVAGHPWRRLLADYDLLAGRVWSLFLVTVLVGPLVVGRWRRRRGEA